MAEERWVIDGIVLADPPVTKDRTINRTFQKETLYQSFPGIFKPAAASYDLTITGFVYPPYVAFALEQIARSADTTIVRLEFPIAGVEAVATTYAVKNLRIFSEGPMFTNFFGEAVEVQKYSMTFTEFADEGENQNSEEGELEGDEEGIGTGDWNELIPEFNDFDFSTKNFDPINIFSSISSGILGI